MATKAYNTQNTDQYFATLPILELLPVLEGKEADYGNYVLVTGKLTQWRTNWEMYMNSENKLGIR